MHVDKYGRNTDTVYTGIYIANLTNSFLWRDECNTATAAIDMNSHIIKNVADPLSNQVVATNTIMQTNTLFLLLAVLCLVV